MTTITLSDEETSILCYMLGLLRGKLTEEEFSMQYAWVTDKILIQIKDTYPYTFKRSVLESTTWEEMEANRGPRSEK